MKILHPEASDPTRYWKHRVKLKNVFTTSSDWNSVSKSMNAIAAVLGNDSHFDDFWALHRFSQQGDIIVANDLLDELYDFCDEHRIWVD